jgi:putative ABC transport system substrate-binding protein
LEQAARSLAVKIVGPEVLNAEDLDGAIEMLANERVEVVIALQTVMLVNERRQIAALLAAKRLPTVYGYREHVDAGGLISYGVDLTWCGRRAATFVHKILNGTPPSELPVEFPTRLEMVVNLKAAKAIGLNIPETFLVRADEVIE